MALVYALFDVANPTEMRYIGKTTWTAQERLKRHLSNARYDASQEPVYRWIRKNRKISTIDVTIIEDNLTEEEANQREIYWIAHYRQAGHRLMNIRSGGDGGTGQTHSEETRVKIGIASTRRWNTAIMKQKREEAKQQREKLKRAREEIRQRKKVAREVTREVARCLASERARIRHESTASNARALRQIGYLSTEWQTRFKNLPDSASKREKIQAKYWLRRAESMI